MSSKKFYDIEPASDGSHYLCENGVQIARYSSIETALRQRDEFVAAEVAHRLRLAFEAGEAVKQRRASARERE